MRRRLDIAASIVITPQLLFLDEPTTGLDPRSRNQVWDIVRVLVAAGTTVLLTTQYLEEADQLADRIAIIDHGKVIAEGTSSELKALVGSGALHIRLHVAEQRADAQRALDGVFGDSVQLEVGSRGALGARLRTRAGGRGARGAGAERYRRCRVRARSAQPRRGVPCADRSHGRRRQRRPSGIATTKPAKRTQHDRHRDDDHPLRGHAALCARDATAPAHAIGGCRLARVRVASDAEDQARADAALRRHGVPDHVRAAVHVPVRWRARGVDESLPPGAVARHPRHDRLDDHDVHRHGVEHRHQQGCVRPVPLAADLATGGAHRNAGRRRGALHDGIGGRHGARDRARLPSRRWLARCRAGDRSAARVRVQPLVGVDVDRAVGAEAGNRHAAEHDRAVPTHVREQRVRRPRRRCRVGCRRS